MGRMFRIITEADHETVTPSDAAHRQNKRMVLSRNELRSEEQKKTESPHIIFDENAVPFVEVGGPSGLTSSVTKTKTTPTQLPSLDLTPPPRNLVDRVPASRINPIGADEEHAPVAPVVSPDNRLLSVEFHTAPKSRMKMIPPDIGSEVVAYHQPQHPVSTAYRAVRDEIRKQFDGSSRHALMFTSASADSGTTTAVINLAVGLAQEASGKVLVVDAAFSRPSVSRRLGVAGAPGLIDVLKKRVPLAWTVQSTAVLNLHVIAAGDVDTMREGDYGEGFPSLLAQLRQWYEWVLVDAGTWVEAVDRDALASSCDGVYLVTRQGDYDRSEFHHLRDLVVKSGAFVRGAVTTRL